MITNILALLAALGVVTGLGASLYAWFHMSLARANSIAAKDVLNRWDAELAELSDAERERQRTQPPIEVLEAAVALPSPRQWRLQLS
jgi:hypothetical protein